MALTQTYVDPSINANSGTGTIGDPYGDLQYALDTMTRDATNGDQVNIKSGTAEVLTGSLDFSTYGTPASSAHLVFVGYTSAANDGGIGVIDGDGSYKIATLPNYTGMKDLELRNSGTNQLITGNQQYCSLVNCELHNQAGGQSYSVFNLKLFGCHLHDLNSTYGTGAVTCHGCAFFDVGLYLYDGYQATKNVFVVTSTSSAIFGHNQLRFVCSGNTILCNGGIGISFTGGLQGGNILDNLIEGASTGIFAQNDGGFIAGNAVFNSSVADYDISSSPYGSGANESLVSSPFEKTGAATFGNLKSYFAPANVGNVRTGAYSSIDGVKGAIGVQQSSGGGGATVHPLYAN